jgi:pyruvate kinase
MARIAERADQMFDYAGWARGLTDTVRRTNSVDEGDAITDAMTSAAWRATIEVKPTAIICISRTGFTVRSIARFRPDVPILGFSQDERTVRQLTMSWGSTPILLDPSAAGVDEMVEAALASALRLGHVRRGDLVAILAGSDDVELRATDTLKLKRVP